MTTPYDWLAKIYTYCSGHMTKMATMPIYGKNSLNIFYSGTKRPMVPICSIGDVGPTRFALVACKNEKDPIINEGTRVVTTLFINF